MNEEMTRKRLQQVEEEFEDGKGVIRIRTSKNRQHNGQKKKYMTYHRVCNWIKTTGATSGAGTAYPSGAHEFASDF
jgi:hypothetical protein